MFVLESNSGILHCVHSQQLGQDLLRSNTAGVMGARPDDSNMSVVLTKAFD